MQLDRIKERMGINEFCEASITAIEFAPAYLVDNIPTECAAVGVANDLAMEIEQMMQSDGELLKYFSVLEVEQPQTMGAALDLAIDLENFERVPDDQTGFCMHPKFISKQLIVFYFLITVKPTVLEAFGVRHSQFE